MLNVYIKVWQNIHSKKKKKVWQDKEGFFFFWGVGGRRGLEPRETGFIEQKVKKQENHGTKVEVTECLQIIQLTGDYDKV